MKNRLNYLVSGSNYYQLIHWLTLEAVLGQSAFDIVQSHKDSLSLSNKSLFRMLFLLVKAKYSGSGLNDGQIILIKDIRRIIRERELGIFMVSISR